MGQNEGVHQGVSPGHALCLCLYWGATPTVLPFCLTSALCCFGIAEPACKHAVHYSSGLRCLQAHLMDLELQALKHCHQTCPLHCSGIEDNREERLGFHGSRSRCRPCQAAVHRRQQKPPRVLGISRISTTSSSQDSFTQNAKS